MSCRSGRLTTASRCVKTHQILEWAEHADENLRKMDGRSFSRKKWMQRGESECVSVASRLKQGACNAAMTSCDLRRRRAFTQSSESPSVDRPLLKLKPPRSRSSSAEPSSAALAPSPTWVAPCLPHYPETGTSQRHNMTSPRTGVVSNSRHK